MQYNNYGIKKSFKKSDDDDGGFQQQNTQLLVDRYDKHMNDQNEWWIIGLKMVPLAQFR